MRRPFLFLLIFQTYFCMAFKVDTPSEEDLMSQNYSSFIAGEGLSYSGKSSNLFNCDCSNLENCTAFCRTSCQLQKSLLDSAQYLDRKRNKKCERVLSSKRIFVKTATLSAIPDIIDEFKNDLRKKNDITKNKINKERCESCEVIDSIKFNIGPFAVKVSSCDKKYIKTYNFKKVFKSSETSNCSKESLIKIKEKVDKYTSSILRNKHKDSEEIWDNCPSDCSFYTNYTLTKKINSCSRELDLNIHCDDVKISQGFLGMDSKYNMEVFLTAEIKCPSLEKKIIKIFR